MDVSVVVCIWCWVPIRWCWLPLQVGPAGAGHFVKMVHNGIEYGDMQLICESYHLMKDVLGLDQEQMAQVGFITGGGCAFI